MSLALGTLTTSIPYDVFCYASGSTPTLEFLAWTNTTTRATALTLQDGVLVKTGATTRRYIGTFYTQSTTTTEDSHLRRLVWNYYNRVEKFMYGVDTTDSWTYTTATWRASNNNTTDGVGRVACVVGVAEDSIIVNVSDTCSNASGVYLGSGVGINSTSTNSAQRFGGVNVAGQWANVGGSYTGVLAAGYNYIQHLENSTAAGTTSWMGDGAVAQVQTGITAVVKG
jgi:hypothetical protein